MRPFRTSSDVSKIAQFLVIFDPWIVKMASKDLRQSCRSLEVVSETRSLKADTSHFAQPCTPTIHPSNPVSELLLID